MDLSSGGCRWQERPRPVWGQGIFEKSPYSLIYSYRKIKVWHFFVKTNKQTKKSSNVAGPLCRAQCSVESHRQTWAEI